eukprot:4343439-Prymnesium_polylepis.1
MAPLKAFLKELEAKVTYVQGGGDPRLLEGCLNVVLSKHAAAAGTPTAGLARLSAEAFGLHSLQPSERRCGNPAVALPIDPGRCTPAGGIAN